MSQEKEESSLKESKTSEEINKNEIEKLNIEIENSIKEIEGIRKRRCFLLKEEISPNLVDKVYDKLINDYPNTNGKIDVIVNSGGGDIDAAYNLSCLFQRYGTEELTFIIPRWAKSAATLVVCSGNEILMTPIAELGPLDPQITELNPLEERLESFSPLHIQTTIDLIRNEYEKGNKNLAEGLLKRLQFPLTLGSFLKTGEIAEQYLIRVLETRMKNYENGKEEAKKIAKSLTKDYVDHGFCINIEEAAKIGLNVIEIEETLLKPVWELHNLIKKINKIDLEKRRDNIKDIMDKLPEDIFDKIKEKKRKGMNKKWKK